METPCLCPFEGHKYGHSQKSGTASGIHRQRIIRLNQMAAGAKKNFVNNFLLLFL